MLRWVILLSVLAVTFAKDCGFPNGTDVGLNYYNCDGSHKMIVKKVELLEKSGEPMYPLDFRKAFDLKVSYSYSGEQLNEYRIDVDLTEYKTALFSSTCKWHDVPTLGLTSNLDGCRYQCPLPTGDADLNMPMDFTAEGGIISTLIGKNAIQMVVHIKDKNTGSVGEEMACLYVQLRALV